MKHKKSEQNIQVFETKIENEPNNSNDNENNDSNSQMHIVKSKLKEYSENNLDENIEKQGGYDQIPIINTDLTEEEKSSIAENIIKEIELDKINLLKEEKKEIIPNTEEKKLELKKRKYLPIDVNENVELIDNNNTIEIKDNHILEVKDKIFKKPCEIENKVLYEGKQFKEDRHKPSNYPININYRCINYRKNEKTRNSLFCNALLKRKEDEKYIYYILEKNHSKECLELITNNIKIETNLIGTYNDYINRCFKYLDSTEEYNKKEFKTALQNIYNENKYSFKLKENTIKNIIGRWKANSLRFTKYNAIENKYNKNNELRLWEYNNSAIYISNKKNPINNEYFIWTSDQIIARARIANHLFIDGTFHHPINFTQLLIIIFKDIISSEYIPGFYILMSNKTEIIYDMVMKSLKKL